MTTLRPDPDEPFPPDEQKLFEQLDGYVELLHRGEAAARSRMLECAAEARPLMDCLESLDNLARMVEGPPDDDGSFDRTVLLSPAFRPETSEGFAGPSGAGQRFGKYQLLGEIGRGGMGVVFKARQTDLDRIVAVKMILAHRLASAEEVRRFYSEARAAGRLNHPHIVGIHEVGELYGQHYFAMDYVDGPSLAELIAQGPIAPETGARLLAGVARAVHYLHQHGIVHRDLKPSNILVDAQGNPYVMDFGLAKVYQPDSEPTRSGTIIGTPSYMAPEQAAGKIELVSARSDVYSLGAILYELLTGLPPFKESTPLDTLVQVLEGEPPQPSKLVPQLPRELELICLKCLEKDPQRRYATADELALDLERYLRGEPIEARPSGALQWLRRWGRREPALASHLVALLLTMTVLQVNYWLFGVDPAYHLWVMSVLGVWVLVSFVFQRFLNRERIAQFTRFAWAAADAILLTTLLFLAGGPLGPLLIGYPVLVAASGLFFRVRLVAFMTLAALISYAALMLLRQEEARPPHYPIVFATTLAVLGFIIAYQVHRVRALSRYYESRRLP